MLFWSTAALITLVVLATLLWPLLRRAGSDGGQAHSPLIAVYRDRQREIEAERASGRLGEADAEAALEELIDQMARELPERDHEAGHAPATGLSRLIAALIILLLPAAAGLVYLQLGAPELTDPDTVAALSSPPSFSAEQVEQLIAQVETRVRGNPEDGEAWLVLASARKFKGDHAGAAEAFERAVRLNPPGARMLAEFAESLAILAQGSFIGRPLKLLEQAMGIDPDDAKAIALMGAAQYQIGNLSAARTLLGRLLDALPQDQAEQRAAMSEVLKRIDDRIAIEGPTAASAPSSAAAAPVEAAPADRSGSSAPARGDAGSDQAAISGSVAIAPALLAQAAESKVLFITARALSGPRIPYAAIRIESPRWPVEFKLDDSQAMDPSRTLSKAGEVVIEARLSRSGQANRQSGDLFAVSGPVRPGARSITLTIDQVVQP
jgi:cytochrome c-type biogenesis protein CcmH